MLTLDAQHADLALRGAVAGLLALHLLNLALPGPRPSARLALGGFVASVFGYLACQRPEMLLSLPRPLAYALLALTVGSAAWLWAAARALFDDHFVFSPLIAGAIGALVLLGLAGNLPYFPTAEGPFLVHAPDSTVARLAQAHNLATLGFSVAALWEVARGWRDDLVAQRRAARRWVALGIGGYSTVALLVELAVRDQSVGLLLPALHVAGIGAITLGLALLVVRRSLDVVLGGGETTAAGPASATPAQDLPATPAVERPARHAQALARLDAAMAQERIYRRDGLTLADLAQHLGLAEAPLRELINQQLGYRNFNDFLHQHRLQEATERLAREDLPILSIALACGYGSIGPFNRAFKQRMGMTPTEFRAGTRMRAGPPVA